MNLFRLHESFLQSELLRDTFQTAHYITIDKWKTREGYEEFSKQYAEQYSSLDKKFTALTRQESFVSAFEQ